MRTPDSSLQPHIERIGGALLDAARLLEPRPGLTDRIMDAAMADPGFKTNLFRFIDVFPVLRSPEAVYQHASEYLGQSESSLPLGLKLGLKAGGLFKGAMERAIASQVESMAQRFIAGVDVQQALPRLRERWQQGLAFSIDLLGEACLSEPEAESYRRRYLDAIAALAAAVPQWPAQPALDSDHLGPIPRANISIKITAMTAKVDAIDHDGSIARLMAGIEPVLAAAAQHGVLVNFDMESHALKDLTLELFMRCCEKHDFAAGLAVQAYLRSAEDDAQRLIDWSRRSGRVVTVRLVKGAYWDYEVIEAERRGWPVPVWMRKADTDACFERVAAKLLHASPRRSGDGGIKLAVGSHNARSIAHALAVAEQVGLPASAVELQMLFGMADGLKRAAVAQGLRLREYTPLGQVIPGMAYLVRRLLENTSNESWLRGGYQHQAPNAELLASPQPSQDPPRNLHDPKRQALSPAVPGVGDGLPFGNEPLRDFADAQQRGRFAAAIVASNVPRVASSTTVEQAGAMLATAAKAFERWRATDVKQRANCLTRAAAIFRQQRDGLAAIVLKESAKPWRHADGDVCEAIDFCEYYARQAVSLFTPRRLGRFMGELDEVWHEPVGPAVVISPWNFPMAIGCGMTVAALVTGNPVVLKPAEQSPGIALRICETLWQAGVPRDVLQFAPGPGETVGAALVRDPRVALVCFTGSMQVGLDILRVAGHTTDQQRHVKRVVCEMGGKNAIIVDASADLDEAVPGVIDSAFGYSGQRCSACSRAIVLDSVHDAFVQRLVEATRALQVGDPRDPGCDVGPLIDDEAGEKVWRYIEIGRGEGTLALAMMGSPELERRLGRPLIGPHIFTGIQPQHRLANEEIFGPVLSVLRARSIDEALDIANNVPYRLTGGIYSRTPTHLEQARRQFRVGNLYINRPSVGALVGRQPFGGFGMSGTGTQAGGDEYLHHFVLPRVVCENTLRRGFAPQT